MEGSLISSKVYVSAINSLAKIWAIDTGEKLFFYAGRAAITSGGTDMVKHSGEDVTDWLLGTLVMVCENQKNESVLFELEDGKNLCITMITDDELEHANS